MTSQSNPDQSNVALDCISCGEQTPLGECPESPVPCGHHCNHSWTHDACDWCGATFGEEHSDG